MSKITASYVAAYIDGEGYLGIMKSERHPTAVNPSYMPVLKVTSVDESIILWFKNSFGGHSEKRVFPNKNQKDAFTWQISGHKLEKILLKVRPYLKLKKPQANIVIQRIRMYKPGLPYNQQEVDIMEELYIQIRKLNKRGKN